VRVLLTIGALVVLPIGTLDAREKSAVPSASSVGSGFSRTSWDSSSLGSIDSNVFGLALGAANCAIRSGTVANPPTLTVIDYSKPSTEKRLWVFDLRSHEMVYEELVAHGQGSGGNVPTLFSNDPETHRTSLGLFVTADTYVGKNGYSLRLRCITMGLRRTKRRPRAGRPRPRPLLAPATESTAGCTRTGGTHHASQIPRRCADRTATHLVRSRSRYRGGDHPAPAAGVGRDERTRVRRGGTCDGLRVLRDGAGKSRSTDVAGIAQVRTAYLLSRGKPHRRRS